MEQELLPKKILNCKPNRKLDLRRPALPWMCQQTLPVDETGHQCPSPQLKGRNIYVGTKVGYE